MYLIRTNLISLLIILIPISSFLIIQNLQGFTLGVFLIFLLNLIFIFTDFNQIIKIFKFSILFLIYYLISQSILIINDGYNLSTFNYFVDNVDYKFEDSILVSLDKSYIFRDSHFTQFLYLITCYSCFYIFRKYFQPNYNQAIFFSSYIIFLYALFLFIAYIIFGYCYDPLSNRYFGGFTSDLLECSYGYQTISLFGVELHRIKGFTSEPSMYVLTALPFTIYAFFHKKYLLSTLGFITLILTFSTTFFITFFILLLFFSILDSKFLVFLKNIIFILLFLAILINLTNLLDILIFDKFNLSALSGIQRYSSFETAITFFSSLSVFSQLFGVGFGTIRSSDLLSTFLVNVGLIGTIIFLYFFLKPIFNRNLNKNYKWVKYCLLSMLIIIMIGVPEFSYLTLWLFLGISYNIMDANKQSKRPINAP
jgi:hypothetical protein